MRRPICLRMFPRKITLTRGKLPAVTNGDERLKIMIVGQLFWQQTITWPILCQYDNAGFVKSKSNPCAPLSVTSPRLIFYRLCSQLNASTQGCQLISQWRHAQLITSHLVNQLICFISRCYWLSLKYWHQISVWCNRAGVTYIYLETVYSPYAE